MSIWFQNSKNPQKIWKGVNLAKYISQINSFSSNPRNQNDDIQIDFFENSKLKCSSLFAVFENEDTKKFQERIELIDSIFNSQDTPEITEILIKNIVNYINKNPSYCSYFVHILFHFANIRIHQRTQFLTIFSIIIDLLPEYRTEILFSTEKVAKEFLTKYKIENGLVFQGILTSKLSNHLFTDSYVNFCKEEDLSYYLIKDDISGFLSYTRNNSDFSFTNSITIPNGIIPSELNIRNSITSAQDLCIYCGSVNCLKYLLANTEFKAKENSAKFAIAGGNKEIIHILEHNSISFNQCFSISVYFHRYELSDWLLTNYKCEIPCISYTLNCFNERAFLFCLLNDGNPNQEFKTSFELPGFFIPLYICSAYYSNFDAISLLLKNGADPNKFSTINVDKNKFTFSPIYAALSNPYISEDIIKLLLDNNADPNLECRPYHKTLSLISKSFVATPLLAACANINISKSIIQLLLSRGANPDQNIVINKQNSKRYEKPLYVACQNPKINIEIIKSLVENGANINDGLQKNRNNKSVIRSPFYIVCSNNNVTYDILSYFLDKGYKINETNEQEDKFGLINRLCSLKYPDINSIRLLLENGADATGISKPISPLANICMNPNIQLEIIKLLFQYGAEKSISKENLLVFACGNPNVTLEIIEFLVDNGCDVNMQINQTNINKKFYQDYYSYYYQKYSNHNYLYNYRTPLYSACANPCINFNIINYLFEKGAIIGDGKNNALIAACENKNPNIDLIQMLLSKGALIKSMNGTILDIALSNVNITFDIIKLLIENGADCKLGAPICTLCKTNYSIEILKLLIENGANVNASTSIPLYADKITPIGILCTPYIRSKFLISHVSTKSTIKNFENSFEMFKLLIENGADVNKIINSSERGTGSPFSLLINLNHGNIFSSNFNLNFNETREIIKYMLTKGKADPNIPYEENGLKTYPICTVCTGSDYDHEILELLIKSNADTNVLKQTILGQDSPLLILARNKYAELSDFKLLLEHGANPNQVCTVNKKEITPLSALLDNKIPNPEFVRILLDFGAKIPSSIKINKYPQTIQDLLNEYKNK